MSANSSSRLAWRSAAVLYFVAIFAGGSWRMPSVSGGVSDKTLHFLVFGGFALALLPALPRAKAAAWRLGVGFLLASTAGALLELWQGLLPHRSAEFLDWVADTLGAAIAVLGAAVGLWFWKRRSAGDPK